MPNHDDMNDHTIQGFIAICALLIIALILISGCKAMGDDSEPSPKCTETDGACLTWGDIRNSEVHYDSEGDTAKCVAGEQVLHHLSMAEAAETCLADLGARGPREFSATWTTYIDESSR